jgi:PAS domain S-box-containing protein
LYDYLQKRSEQVQACLERAFEAECKAWVSADPALKADFLQMEKRWLALARSYEFSERLTDFTAENADWRRRFDERLRVRARQDDEPRLQRIIQEGDVNALFERMWLSSIVEFSDDAIMSTSLDGTITSWNKGAERLYGYSAEAAIGKPVTILIPPDRQYEEDAILRLIRRGERVEHYETVRQRQDGRLVDISLTISPIRGAERMSWALQRLPVTLPSVSGSRRRFLFSLARPNTEPKTYWRTWGRWCSSHRLTHPMA